jgi:hypothetical protein
MRFKFEDGKWNFDGALPRESHQPITALPVTLTSIRGLESNVDFNTRYVARASTPLDQHGLLNEALNYAAALSISYFKEISVHQCLKLPRFQTTDNSFHIIQATCYRSTTVRPPCLTRSDKSSCIPC